MDRSGRKLPHRCTEGFGSRPRHAAHRQFCIDGDGRRGDAGPHVSGPTAVRCSDCHAARPLQHVAARRYAHGACMNILRILFILGALGVASAGAATTEFPNVRDDSYTEPNGSRVLKLSIIIDTPVNKIWNLLISSEGWQSWAVPVAWVEFGIGGMVETSYTATAVR